MVAGFWRAKLLLSRVSRLDGPAQQEGLAAQQELRPPSPSRYTYLKSAIAGRRARERGTGTSPVPLFLALPRRDALAIWQRSGTLCQRGRRLAESWPTD